MLPHKYSGLDLSNIPPSFNKQSQTVANKYFYRIYKFPKILLDSVVFDSKIRALDTHDIYVYVALKKQILVMKHKTLIRQIDLPEKPKSILLLYPILLVLGKSCLYMIVEDRIDKISFGQDILGVAHLPTYLNKVIIWTQKDIKVVNILTHKIVVEIESPLKIRCVRVTPALDVIAIGSDDKVVLFDIQEQNIISSYDSGLVQDIAFTEKYMAISSNNEIQLIDLNQQVIMSSYLEHGFVDWIRFHNDNLLVGSSECNSIKELSCDINQPQLFYVLRERKGLRNFTKEARFIGLEDEPLSHINVLMRSSNEIRFMPIINENMAQTFSYKQDESQIDCMSFSINSALTIQNNKPNFWSIENKTQLKLKVDEKYAALKCCYVTKCGNFGFLADNKGKLMKVGMKTGYVSKVFQLEEQVNILYADIQNTYLFCANDSKLIQLDFLSTKLINQVDNIAKIAIIKGSNTTGLLLTAHLDNDINLWEFSSLKKVRSFQGHTKLIYDATLSNDNQFMISCSQDLTLRVWNVISGQCISLINIDKPIISVDISSDNQFVITAFVNSRSLAVWNFRPGAKYSKTRFCDDLVLKSDNQRKAIYENQRMKREIDEAVIQLEYPQAEEDDLINFTQLQEGKWVPIQYIDAIRERNKVKVSDSDIKVPFLMDFSQLDEHKEKLLNEIKEKISEKSKILKEQKDKFIAEVPSSFESKLNSNSDDFLEYLKSLNPSHFDYEIRSLLLGKPKLVEQLLLRFNELFDSSNDFDLKMTYFQRIVQLGFDELKGHRDIISEIVPKMKLKYYELEELKQYVESVIDYIKII